MTNATSLLNGLSSVSAYALANPQAEAITALVAVGIAGAATLATITYRKMEAYGAKKHKDKLKAINVLHRKFLQNLTAPGGVKVPGLPKFFSLALMKAP